MTFRLRDSRSPAILLGLLAALALVGGCSKKDKIDPPAELSKLKDTIKVERVWSVNVGGKAPKLRLGVVYDFRNPPESGMRTQDLYAAIME